MMESVKLPKDIKSITVLRAGAPVTVYKAEAKRKKQSRPLRGIEKLTRRLTLVQSEAADSYGKRHSRSNRKRKDGWLRDLAFNLARAQRDGFKKLRLAKLFGL